MDLQCLKTKQNSRNVCLWIFMIDLFSARYETKITFQDILVFFCLLVVNQITHYFSYA